MLVLLLSSSPETPCLSCAISSPSLASSLSCQSANLRPSHHCNPSFSIQPTRATITLPEASQRQGNRPPRSLLTRRTALPLQAAPSSSMHKALLLPLQMDSPTSGCCCCVDLAASCASSWSVSRQQEDAASPLLHCSCLALEQDAWLRCWDEEAAFGNIIHRTNQREAPWPMGASHSVWFLMVCSSGLSGWKQNETKQPSSIVLIRQHALVSRWFLLVCLA